MDTNIFLAGFIGALAPEVLRLYKLRSQPQAFETWYLGISLVYALLGGYVATIAPGVEQAWWAFAVGAGLDTVVNTAVKLAGSIGADTAAPPEALEAADAEEGLPAPAAEPASAFRRFTEAL